MKKTIVIFTLLLSSLSLPVFAQPPLYYITDLGTFGGDWSYAIDINELGEVVGDADTAQGNFRAFLWQNGTMQDLGTLGGTGSVADDINELGQVVGDADTAQGISRAFLWQNGTMQDLGTLGGNQSEAMASMN